MKKYQVITVGLISILAIVGLVGCTGGGSPLQVPPAIDVNVKNPQTGIWVTGQGTVSVAPNIAVLNLGISAQSPGVAQAQAQAATAMDKVMTALTDNGVAKKDIQTRSFSIQQVTRFDRSKEQEVVIGYRVTNTVSAKIRTIDKTGAVIDAVASAGGDLTRINNISFTIDDNSAYQKEAREKAMADAKAKAEQMAGLAGVKLGKPVYITESFYAPPVPIPILRSEAGAPAPTTPISPGEMDITVTVQVHYAIQ
ncbi:MAG: SIMPL domain-containing protein [Chloroflexi bacterium]|nr:SIMPL domain-containing protein [Chloroflexota bacterium]